MKSYGDLALIAEANGTGPEILFIHGIGGAADIWQTQLTTFCGAGHARVAAINLPGYGGRSALKEVTFEDHNEKILREILRVGNGIAAPTREGENRPPISLAKLVQCFARRFFISA